MINYVRLTKEITSARARFTSASGACPLFLSGVVQDSKGRRLTLKGEPTDVRSCRSSDDHSSPPPQE
jgi:hypothetical protein